MAEDAAPKELRTRTEVEERYGIGRRALEWMAHTGTGPRFYRIAGKAMYRNADVDAWIEQQAVEPAARAG